VIRQNLWWSFAYNFIALPLAIAGHVTPWMAGIGMSASSLLVVLNSLRIQRMETGLMESIYLLIPISVILVFVIAMPSGGRCAAVSSTISKAPGFGS
jgi:hypothetical protein